MELIGICIKNILVDNGFDIYDFSYFNLDNYCIFIFQKKKRIIKFFLLIIMFLND